METATQKRTCNPAYEAPLANMKMELQKWPEMLLILGRSGTQYIAMVTKLLSTNCGAHLQGFQNVLK